MNIIAHGKESIAAAVQSAEVALNAGVKRVTIEFTEASLLSVVVATTLTYCPVAECRECDAAPCPFGHQAGNAVDALQDEYTATEARLNEIGRKLREVKTHG